MAEDTLALLSRHEAYEAVNDPAAATAVSSDRDAEVVAIWVPAVSRRIDELCGPVVVRTVTDERHDGGTHMVALVRSPADSVTTLTEYSSGVATVLTAEQDTTLPADGYLLDRVGTTSFVYRRSSGSDVRFAYGRQNVKVTYQAGRYADTASVDAKFKLTAANVLKGLWSKYAGAWAAGPDPFEAVTPKMFNEIDHEVKKYLSDEMRPPAVA